MKDTKLAVLSGDPMDNELLDLLESAIYAYRDLPDAKPERVYAPFKRAAEKRLFEWIAAARAAGAVPASPPTEEDYAQAAGSRGTVVDSRADDAGATRLSPADGTV